MKQQHGKHEQPVAPFGLRFAAIFMIPTTCFFWALCGGTPGLNSGTPESGFYGIAVMFFVATYGSVITMMNLLLACVSWKNVWVGALVACLLTTIIGVVGWNHCRL